jgi:hypothetical protein
MQFFDFFFLVGPVTLKKPVRTSVQVFSGRITKPVWFLKLCVQGVAQNLGFVYRYEAKQAAMIQLRLPTEHPPFDLIGS